jgi:hypothetical protein
MRIPNPEDELLPPETEEDRIVVKFLRTGKDPERRARTILTHLLRENKPLSARVRYALAILFDPATKPRRLVIKRGDSKKTNPNRSFHVAVDIYQEMRNPANRDARGRLLRKRIIGMVGDRYGISRSSVEAFWKKNRKEAEAMVNEHDAMNEAVIDEAIAAGYDPYA